MIEVNREEMETQLNRLLDKVSEGEEVIIAEGGKPVAKLIPYHTPRNERVSGTLLGQIQVSEDFDDPLPPEFLLGPEE